MNAEMTDDELLAALNGDSTQPADMSQMSDDDFLAALNGDEQPATPRSTLSFDSADSFAADERRRSLGEMYNLKIQQETGTSPEESLGKGMTADLSAAAYNIGPFAGRVGRENQSEVQQALAHTMETGEVPFRDIKGGETFGETLKAFVPFTQGVLGKEQENWDKQEGAKYDLYERAKNGEDVDYSPVLSRVMGKDGRYHAELDENGSPLLDPKYRGGAEAKDAARKAHMKEFAANMAGQMAESMSRAAKERAADISPWYAQMAQIGSEQLGYGNEFLVGGSVMQGLGLTGALGTTAQAILAGEKTGKLAYLGKLGIEAAVPSLLSAAERFEKLTTDDIGIDDKGEVYLRDSADGWIRAGAKAAVGGVAESMVEAALGDVVGKVVNKTAQKAVGSIMKRFPEVGKFFTDDGRIGTTVKNKWFDLVKNYNKVAEMTKFGNPFGEFAEEYAQGALDEVMGFDVKHADESKSVGDFTGEFFDWDANMKELTFGILGQMAIQAAGGHAMERGRRVVRSINHDVVGALKEHNMTTGEIMMMTPSRRIAMAVEVDPKLMESVGYTLDELCRFSGIKDKDLENMSVDDKLKVFSVLDSVLANADGKSGVEETLGKLDKKMQGYINLIDQRSMLDGNWKNVKKANARQSRLMWVTTADRHGNINWLTDDKGERYIADANLGAKIIDNGDGTFRAEHPECGFTQTFNSMDKAADWLTAIDRAAQERADIREKKREYIANVAERLVPTRKGKNGETYGANVICFNNEMEALREDSPLSDAEKAQIAKGSGTGISLGGGKVAMFLDNCRTVGDALYTLSHELGHAGLESGTKDKQTLKDVIKSAIKGGARVDADAMAMELIERTAEGNPQAEQIAAEEGLVYGHERQQAVASPLRRAVTAVKMWMRKRGIDNALTGLNDADYAAIVRAGLRDIKRTDGVKNFGETNAFNFETELTDGADEIEVQPTADGGFFRNANEQTRWISDYRRQQEALEAVRANADAAEAERRRDEEARKRVESGLNKAPSINAQWEQREQKLRDDAEIAETAKDAAAADPVNREAVPDLLDIFNPGGAKQNENIAKNATAEELDRIVKACQDVFDGVADADAVDAVIKEVTEGIAHRAEIRPVQENYGDTEADRKELAAGRKKARDEFKAAAELFIRTVANGGSKGVKISEAKERLQKAVNGLRRLPQMPWDSMGLGGSIDRFGNIIETKVASFLKKLAPNVKKGHSVAKATAVLAKMLDEIAVEHLEGQKREAERVKPLKHEAAKRAAASRKKNALNVSERKYLEVELDRAWTRYVNALHDASSYMLIPHFNGVSRGSRGYERREDTPEAREEQDRLYAEADRLREEYERIQDIVDEYDATTEEMVDAYLAAQEETADAEAERPEPIIEGRPIDIGDGNRYNVVSVLDENTIAVELGEDGDAFILKNTNGKWEVEGYEEIQEQGAGKDGGTTDGVVDAKQSEGGDPGAVKGKGGGNRTAAGTSRTENAEGKVANASSFSRSRVDNIVFRTPFVGKTGAKLVAYSWKNKKIEDFDKNGDDVVRKISDWEESLKNENTNRDIVHHFTVVDADGKSHVVSAETAAKMLGVDVGNVRGEALKLVRRQMKLSGVTDAQKKAISPLALKEKDMISIMPDGGVRVVGFRSYKDGNHDAPDWPIEVRMIAPDGSVKTSHLRTRPDTKYFVTSKDEILGTSEKRTLTLDGGTVQDIAAEEKSRRDRAEIERRRDAPLKGGTGEVGQTLMDLGGAEGEDLFNRTAKWRRGVPYQGSKSRIADDIVAALPNGKRFVDLFSGGGAMTHSAMLSGKYDSYRMNDLDGVGQRLFLGGVRGEYDNYDRPTMTADEFAAAKGTPEALMHSFNGLGRNVTKKDLVTGRDRAQEQIRRVKELASLKDKADAVESSESDYREVELKDGDVVYADIPYGGVDSLAYGKGRRFDRDAFIEWAQNQSVPVYVSEYAMPEGWTEIKSFKVPGMRGGERTEKLFVQSKFAKGQGRWRRITPAEDAAYADAVKRGDLDTALRMIREAAAKNPNAKLIHTDPILREDDSAKAFAVGGMPKELAREIAKWDVVKASPYSDSFYNMDGKSWENTPDGIIRVSDHWNFTNKRHAGVHAKTDIDVSNGEEWAMAKYHADTGVYEVLKKFPYLESRRYTRTKSYRQMEQARGIYQQRMMDAAKASADEMRRLSNESMICLDASTGEIKSADITYDDNGNLIPLSERFNAENADIRWRRSNSDSNLIWSRFESILASKIPAMQDRIEKVRRLAEKDIKNGGSDSPIEMEIRSSKKRIADLNKAIKWYKEHGQTDDVEKYKQYVKEEKESLRSYEENLGSEDDVREWYSAHDIIEILDAIEDGSLADSPFVYGDGRLEDATTPFSESFSFIKESYRWKELGDVLNTVEDSYKEAYNDVVNPRGPFGEPLSDTGMWRRHYTPNLAAQFLADRLGKSMKEAQDIADILYKQGGDYNTAIYRYVAMEKLNRDMKRRGSLNPETAAIINGVDNAKGADAFVATARALKSREFTDVIREKLQDSLIHLRRMEERYGIGILRSVYDRFDKNYGLVAKEMDDFQRELRDPLAKELQEKGYTGDRYHVFSLHLNALHGAERNRMIAERSAVVKKALTDPRFTAAERQAVRDFIEGNPQTMITVAPIMENGKVVGERIAVADANLARKFKSEEAAQLKRDLAGSGRSTAFWNEVLRKHDADGVTAELTKAVDLVRKMTQRTRDILVKHGRLSAEQARLWEQLSPNYVPMKSDVDMNNSFFADYFLGGGEEIPGGGTKSYRKGEFNRAHGRTTVADDPLAFVIQQYEAALGRAFDNSARQRLADAVRRNANLGKVFIYLSDAERRDVVRRIAILNNIANNRMLTTDEMNALKSLKQKLAEANNASDSIPTTKVMGADGIDHIVPNITALEGTKDKQTTIVAFKENGDLKFIKLGGFTQEEVDANSDLLADSDAVRIATEVKKQNMVHWAWTDKLRKLTGWFSAMRTAYTPTFIASNFLADNTQALRNLIASFGGDSFLAKKDAEVAAKFEKYMFHALVAARAVLAGKFDGTKTQIYAKEWYENGGRIGGIATENIRDLQNSLAKDLKLLAKDINFLDEVQDPKELLKILVSGKGFGQRLEAVKRFSEYWNSVVEMSTRIAAYATARDMMKGNGLSEEENIARAVKYSRDVTVNFNRKGAYTPVINALYAFSNATMQDLVRSVEAFGEGRTGKALGILGKRGFKIALFHSVLGFLSAALGFWSDDPDEEKEGRPQYKDTKEFIKQNSISFRVPGTEKQIAVPLRGLMRMPYYLGHEVYEVLFGKKGVGKAAADMTKLAADNLTDFIGAAPNAVQFATPSVLKPAAEIIQNQTFTGSQMYREPFDGDNDTTTVRANMGRGSTSVTAKAIAKGLNWLGGALTPGRKAGEHSFLDMQPEKIEAVWNWIGGGLSRDVTQIGRTIWDIGHLRLPEVRNFPFLSRVVKPLNENSAGFYEARREYDDVKKRFDAFAAEGDTEMMKRLADEHPYLQRRNKRWNTELTDLKSIANNLLKAEQQAEDDETREQIHEWRLKSQYMFRHRLENPPEWGAEDVEEERGHNRIVNKFLKARKREEKKAKREKERVKRGY